MKKMRKGMKLEIEEIESVNKIWEGKKRKMKTKTKILVLMEIAIVLCSVFLMTLPAMANAAEEDDFVLGVYGNANEDDTIDMRDLTYVKLIFFGKKPETELADAKYDGQINPLDFIQIKLIIVGKEKEITIVDSADRIVTVKKPIKRIIPLSHIIIETMRSLKATDKIVAVVDPIPKRKIFYQELSDLPCVGGVNAPDYEKIAELQPDVFIVYSSSRYDETADKVESIVPGVTVIRINSGWGCKTDVYIDNVRMYGYIFDRKDEAEVFSDWFEGTINKINARTEGFSEDEKPRVFFTYPAYFPNPVHTLNRLNMVHDMIVDAGGINIAADLSGTAIDPEWVIEQDPEIILGKTFRAKGKFEYGVGDTTEAEALIDRIKRYPGWGNIAAVKSDNVYLMATPIATTPHYPIGVAYLAKCFYPDLFEDLDPLAIHQEYLDRFQCVDFNVYEDAVFVYPPLK